MIGGEDNGKSPGEMSAEEISARFIGTLSTSLEAIRLEIRALTMATLSKPETIVHATTEIEGIWTLADAAAKLVRDTVYIDEGDTS